MLKGPETGVLIKDQLAIKLREIIDLYLDLIVNGLYNKNVVIVSFVQPSFIAICPWLNI